MKIGFMTNALAWKGMKEFEKITCWAVENGFTDMEVGPSVPLEKKLYQQVLANRPIQVTALTYCRNFLSTDLEEAKVHRGELTKRIRFASAIGIEKIITSTGIDKTLEEGVYDKADSIRKTPARSLEQFEKVFTPIVRLAEECGVKLAFENCPLMGNIAISPVMWREIFNLIDSPNVGLAYDPSHLVWQMIDPYKPIEEFGSKIFHVHAKDTVINRQRLAESGFLTDFSWWRYCIPGNGELDWLKLFRLLRKAGFDGTISMEHEDSDFDETVEKVKEGLCIGKMFLDKKIIESEGGF